MTRGFGLGLLALALAVSACVAADDAGAERREPPLRLKKKDRGKPAPRENKQRAEPEDAAGKDRAAAKKLKPRAKEGGPGGGSEPDGTDPALQAREALARAAKNMRASEGRLAKRDPGAGTRQIQRDILQDLNALIEQKQRGQPQQQQDRQPRNASATGQSQPQRIRQGRPRQTSQAQTQGRRQPEGMQAGQGGGAGGKTGVNKMADLYKDVWGHLPETLRQEMDQYSREQFMAKYNDLLKQYYATIAENGRRKAE